MIMADCGLGLWPGLWLASNIEYLMSAEGVVAVFHQPADLLNR